MVRKTQFTPEDVVGAAFTVVAKLGLGSLTARNVAEQLGSSTAPVYSNFANMEELEAAAFGCAVEKLMEYTSRRHTENLFLNIGVGVLKFTRDYPLWYQAFGSTKEPGQNRLGHVLDSMLETIGTIPDLKGMPTWERKILLRKMTIFTHGLASEVSAGHVSSTEFEDFLLILEEVGEALTAKALTQPERRDEDKKRLSTFCHEYPTSSEENLSPEKKDDDHEINE